VAYARAHTLIGQFDPFTSNAGWYMGVSGNLDRAAQYNFEEDSGDTLSAYVSMTKANNVVPDLLLDTPIESGRYTHMAMSFRYIDGASNEIVLYKDGRVTASGITNDDIVSSNTSLLSSTEHRPLTIGGCDMEAQTAADLYTGTSGWGNLMSGVYYFRRVLHEGEVLELHERGGLVPEEAFLQETKSVEINDVDLVGHYPFVETGYADVSTNHRPLISNYDIGFGDANELGPKVSTGPFGGGGVFNSRSLALFVSHAATSGVCYDTLSQGSWTIGGYISANSLGRRDHMMLFSWGSVTPLTGATANTSTSSLTENSAGICCTVSGITNQQKYVIEVYPDGSTTSTETIIFNIDGFKEYYRGAACHLALAYDDSTMGVAAYLNGVLQGSGILSQSLTTQLTRITGSGFPLIFGNGVENTLNNTSNRGTHEAGGFQSSLGPFTVFKRALLPSEIRAVAISGINFSALDRSPNDPRLMGYWSASDFKIDDIIVEDQARCWNEVTGNLVRGDSFAKQERWYDRDHDETVGTIFRDDGTARYNQFGERTLPPELVGQQLGMTSGTFSVRGGSVGTNQVTDALGSRSSIGNLSFRYKPAISQRDKTPQSPINEFVLSYEVTPSGDIPATLLGLNSNSAPAFNSALHTYGDALTASTTLNPTRSYLTTLEAGSGSGVSLVWLGEDNTPLVSGNISFGVPTRVLLHGKFDLPNQLNAPFTGGAAPYSVSMWIGGELVHRREMTAATVKLWAIDDTDSFFDAWALSFGGMVGNSTSYTTEFTNLDSGLGDTYLREVFVMKGIFRTDEIESLAVSGIQTPSVAGFTNTQLKTQVSVADSNLVAYYRFNGGAGGGSGTTDLSFNGNHLRPVQQNLVEDGVGRLSTGAFQLRAFPGPFENSDLGVQCSGFTYSSVAPTASTFHLMPPFMASGVGFSRPDKDFSVGFFYIRKKNVLDFNFDTIVAYGNVAPTVATTELDISPNYGWAIGTDHAENMHMLMTISGVQGERGNMYAFPNASAAQSGQLLCGTRGEVAGIRSDARQWEQHHLGNHKLPRKDSWSHYYWTYSEDDRELKHYVNGDLIDRQRISHNFGPQNPIQDSRYLTFFQHTTTPWVGGPTAFADYEGSLTDFSYFNKTLTQAEVRYIASNGIDDAVGTPTSGILGGLIHGQDTVSGIFGGLSKGQDTVSGVFGGYVPAGTLGSGILGGFVSGVVFGDGTLGGFVRGQDIVSGVLAGYIVGVDVSSGVIAGYIRGQEVSSGIFGGLIFGGNLASGIFGGLMQGSDMASGILGGFALGGLEGNFQFDAGYTIEVMAADDFDAQVEIAKTVSSDFDAKIVIFQDEQPPLIDIVTPSITVSGLAPPFNQYFVGKASGQQGKTIDSTRWNFGDFTPTVSVAESGAGCYPIQHNFASSGFYIVKFEAIDSDGLHASATRIVNAASGIDPVTISLSGVPRSGNTVLTVDFTTNIDILPTGVTLSTQLLYFDDGQSTISFNPTHSYPEPGTYKPIWCVRDSRGVIWCDSLEAGNDYWERGF